MHAVSTRSLRAPHVGHVFASAQSRAEQSRVRTFVHSNRQRLHRHHQHRYQAAVSMMMYARLNGFLGKQASRHASKYEHQGLLNLWQCSRCELLDSRGLLNGDYHCLMCRRLEVTLSLHWLLFYLADPWQVAPTLPSQQPAQRRDGEKGWLRALSLTSNKALQKLSSACVSASDAVDSL